MSPASSRLRAGPTSGVKGSNAGIALLCLVVGCAQAVPCPEVPRSGPPPAPSKERFSTPLARAAYLSPSIAGGALDCLDPASEVVRRTFRASAPALDSPIDARALAEDVGEIHGILQRQYAGFPQLLQNPTFDVDAFFKEWRISLEQGPPTVSFEDAVLSRLVQLKLAAGDRHLRISGFYRYFSRHPKLAVHELSAAAPAGLDPETCRPERAVLQGTLRVAPSVDGSVLVASVRGPASNVTVRCGAAELVLTPRPAALFSKPPPYALETVGDAALITLGDLSDPAALEPFLLDIPTHRKTKLLVIDLRNNGGGSDAPIYRFVEQMASGVYGDVVHVTGASAQRCAGWNNKVVDQLLDGSIDAPEAQQGRADLLQTFAQPAPEQPSVGPSIQRFNAKHPYRGRVIVLVNRESASSAEGAARLLAGALGATLVGERTGGYFELGEVTPFVMSNTGISWDIPTKRFYVRPRVEEVGLPVDFYLPAKQLAMPAKELLPMLRELPLPGR